MITQEMVQATMQERMAEFDHRRLRACEAKILLKVVLAL